MRTGKKKISLAAVLRAISQIIFFVFLPSLYISTFSGIKQIWLDIINKSFNFETLLPQIVTAIAIIPITIFTGRFFCGWMCAFGAFLDFVYAVSKKLFDLNLKVSERADRVLKYIKYVLLLFLIAAVWSSGIKIFSTSNPWDAFGMLLTVGKAPDFSYVISNLLPAFLVFVLIVAVSFFVERFFCRYLCPLGAIFAITSKLRVTSIFKPNDKCGKCRVCTNACPMGLPLYKKSSFKSGECINCFKCVSACPRKNISLAVSENDVRPVIAGTMAVAAMTGIYYAGTITTKAVESNVSTSQTGASATANKVYKDGTYEGSGTGFRGSTTTVSVTVKNDKITDVKTVSYGDDEQFFDRAYSTVAQKIISQQSANVDTVSGATYSSRGIMQAVENALSKAKISQSESGGTSETASSASNSETQSADSANESASSSASENTSASNYSDGTYEGSGIGFRGSTTTVSVTVKNNKITDVKIVSYGDDEQFFDRAYPTIVQEIVSQQSANVDTVSGATYSSRGIMQAVENALSKALK